MKITQTSLGGVYLLSDFFVQRDDRGSIVEIWNASEWSIRDEGWNSFASFVKINQTTSRQRVLRGVHTNTCWRLFHVSYGRIFLAIVDCDPASKTFGQHVDVLLDDQNDTQVLVRPDYGIGHLILSQIAVLTYWWSDYYREDSQKTFRYDDPRFGIEWPLDGKKPILSERDKNGSS